MPQRSVENSALPLLCRAVALGALAASSGHAPAQLSFVPSRTPFTDIRTTGTPIPLSDDGEAILTIDQLGPAGWGGNSVFTGGVSVLVGNNGGIIWNPLAGVADQVGFLNTTIPGTPSNSTATGNGNGVRQFLAVLWDDYLPSAVPPATEVDWQVIEQDLIIQWTLEDHFEAIGPGRVTFQVRFYDNVSALKDGIVASLIYDDTFFAAGQNGFNDGASATIGYNGNGIGTAPGSVLYSFNTPSVSGYSESANPDLTPALNLFIPAPSAGGLLGVTMLAWLCRRR